MILGLLQKLDIIRQSDTELLLREQPLLEWLAAGVLTVIAINMALLDLSLTAGAAFLIGLYLIVQAQTRLIHFNAASDTLTVSLKGLLRNQQPVQERLANISRAYLQQDEEGATQIILVRVDGEEMGLSVHSRDAKPWKEEITIAINELLHEAHRDDADPDAVI